MTANVLILVLFVAVIILSLMIMSLETRANSLHRRKEMFKRLWTEVKRERQELLTDRAAKRAEVTKVINSQQKEIWALRDRRTELLREVSDLKEGNRTLLRAVNKRILEETKTPLPPFPSLDRPE